jgi:hypothetical protein
MAVLLSYAMPSGATGSIWLDASVSEQHGAQAQVTEHQVESGANIADYVRPMPRKLSLQGFVTNTPITSGRPQLPSTASTNVVGELGGAQQSTLAANGQSYKALTFGVQFDRVKTVYDAIVEAVLAGATFSVFTSLATYTNLIVTNFSAPRDAEHGNAIQFQIDFQEVRIVDSQTVQALPAKVRTIHRARQTTKPAEEKPAEKARSFLRSVVKAIGG